MSSPADSRVDVTSSSGRSASKLRPTAGQVTIVTAVALVLHGRALVRKAALNGDEATIAVIARMMRAYLTDHRPPADFHALKPLLPELVLSLSVIAKASRDPAQAFAAGWARLLVAEPPPALSITATVDELGTALERLTRANAAIRRRVVDAVAHTVAADGRVSPHEAELMRLTCATLGTPLPLFRDFWAT